MLRLTSLLGIEVRRGDGSLGRLTDLGAAAQDGWAPLVETALVRRRRGRGDRIGLEAGCELRKAPWWSPREQRMLPNQAPGLLLARHVLDAQLIDLEEKRLVRVGDVLIAEARGRPAAGAGWRSAPGRCCGGWGWGRARRRGSETIDWSDLHFTSTRADTLQLSVPRAAITTPAPGARSAPAPGGASGASCGRAAMRRASALVALAAVAGPGLLAGLSDDDPAGIATYSILGADYGYELLWVLLLSTVALVIFHEAGARMGVATGQGLMGLIRDRYGVRLAGGALVALLLANVGTTCAEFAGVAASLELAGISKYVSVPLAAVGVSLLVLRGGFHRVEHVLLALEHRLRGLHHRPASSPIPTGPRRRTGWSCPRCPRARRRCWRRPRPSARPSRHGASPSSSPTSSTSACGPPTSASSAST